MDAEGSKEIRVEEAKKNMDFEAQIGRSFAPEFVSILASNAADTIREWMKKNNCPKQVIDLFDHVIMLERDTIHLENHDLSDWDATGLAQEIGNITELIAQLGGEFQNKYLVTNPRENVITWQPAPSASPALQE